MSSEAKLDPWQSRGGGASLSHDTPIPTRGGRHVNADQDAEEDETEHTSPRPQVPAPLPPSTPVQQLIFTTEVDAEMPGNMMANDDHGSAGEPTVTRQQKTPQYQLPPEFVPAAACGPGQNGPQAAAGEMPPPAMFVKIRTACAEAVPICFTLQEELQREEGLREYTQMAYFSRVRRVGDCLLDIRLTTDILEARVMRDIVGQANTTAVIAEQRDAAVAEVERLRRQLQQMQAELVAATAAAGAYQDGSGRGGPRAGGGSGVQPPSSYSQVIGDLRRRPDPHDVPPSYSGYWEPSDGGSPIPLLKNNMDFPRSTSDLRKGSGGGGVDKGGDLSSPSGDSSLHPSSSASNIRPRNPTPFRGQITPQLPPDEGVRPPPSSGNNGNGAGGGGGGAFQMRGPPQSNSNANHNRDGENSGRQTSTYYNNSNNNNRSSHSRAQHHHNSHGQRNNYNGPRGGGNSNNNANAMTPHHGSSSSSRGGDHRQQQQQQREQQEEAAAAAAFNVDDGLKLDKVGGEWRRELEQVFTLFAGWVRKNCRTPNPSADSQIAGAFPRLWAYMLSVTYPDNAENAASHVRFLLSDPEIRCYFICRLLLQYVVMDVFRIESWLGVSDRSTAQLQIIMGTRDMLIDDATGCIGNHRNSDDNDSFTNVPPIMRISRRDRHRLQVAQAECVSRMLSGPDWPRFRQLRINACVNRFKDIVGPLMDERASRHAASHDLYSIAVNSIETSARVLSSNLGFNFCFSDTGVKFVRAQHHAINSSRDAKELQSLQWRIMCVVTPAVTVRDDSGEGPELRIVAKAKVMVMA
ncbi:hypothetical protein MAPG_08466 [Magnaporthiopsis poae ATCC 64411]|uniref:Uncharacterized protein n=1 Tax=Magnaporthiopsis poae (strain ATCC 64411 / 73-15) TaxID=644358 RepID=A0A0C4E7F3_MAGP6|nr:hypothetical protein MAPG_08466 [Magnaporthiopsis poae ATCC 64411]